MSWLWTIVSLFFFIIGCYLSIFSAFLFDAPESTSNPFILSLFYSIISIPLLSMIGILTGESVYPILVFILITGWITLLTVAIGSVSTFTIKYDDMKQFMKQTANGLLKKAVPQNTAS
jgi:hypothetical protein